LVVLSPDQMNWYAGGDEMGVPVTGKILKIYIINRSLSPVTVSVSATPASCPPDGPAARLDACFPDI
jgi:hypothetical protein